MATNLTKHQSILVRACKSKDARRRLRSVYKHFYVSEIPTNYILASIIVNLVDDYCDIKISRVITDMYEKMCIGEMFNDDKKDHDKWDYILSVLINYIRFADVDLFPGFIKKKM